MTQNKPNVPQTLQDTNPEITVSSDYQQIDNPHSVITSADTKLAYNKDKDRFETVLIGDINAFPEGLTVVDNWTEQDILGNTADALESQVPNNSSKIALNLPKYAYDNQNGWLTSEKDSLKDEINQRLDTVVIKSGEGLDTRNGTIEVFDYPVDGYINISDRSTGLEELRPEHDGANSPYAVWNPEIQETSKLGLLETANQITEELDYVSSVDYNVVNSVDEVLDYFPEEGSKILKCDLYGTHGDQVIAFDTDDLEEQILDHEVNQDMEYIMNKIGIEEDRVASKHNRSDTYSMIDEDGFFTEGLTDKALLEDAVADTYVNDAGDELDILQIDGNPVDIVPLVIYNPEIETPELQVTTVRTSLDDDLNANRGSSNFEPQSLHDTWYNGFNENVNYDGTLEDLMSDMADRAVDFEYEILPAVEAVGLTAYTIRNQTAEKAAQNYLEE